MLPTKPETAAFPSQAWARGGQEGRGAGRQLGRGEGAPILDDSPHPSHPLREELAFTPEERRRQREERQRRLHTRTIPILRVAGFLLLALAVHLHERFRGVEGGGAEVFAGISLGYALASWALLRALRDRVRRFEMGDLFLGTDLVLYAVAIYVSGADRSWLYPVMFVRPADQVTSSPRRVVAFGALAMLCYGGVLVAVSGREVAWSLELFKVAGIGLFALYLGLVSLSVTRMRDRTRAAFRLASESLTRLERSAAELEAFSFVASHDLMEQLSCVSRSLGYLERHYGASLDERARSQIDFALSGAHRMETMVRDLRTFVGVGREPGRRRLVAADQALRTALEQLASPIAETGARIQVDGPLPTVQADPAELETLFFHLLDNALKFRSDEPPALRVAAARAGGEWHFAVTDNGIGFDPAFAAKMFSLFGRLHVRDRYPGNGVGLALCRKILEEHGGWIRAEALPEGGAVFRFGLPVA